MGQISNTGNSICTQESTIWLWVNSNDIDEFITVENVFYSFFMKLEIDKWKE